MARTAIVTGGASGIGLALGSALVQRGVEVVLADIDGEKAKRAASSLFGPGSASGAHLDVRDPDAVVQLVHDLHQRCGRLDFLFNNAGVGVGGETMELGLEHWDRAVDVNLRGVVHGVHAAYPVMVEQGHGHIVNTASLSGLVPAPMITPYAATKHAVVGLSASLRAEAAGHGIRVSVVCPGVIDTPILDSTGPADLPIVPSAARGGREMLVRLAGRPYPASALAEDVLRGVARNKAVIVSPRRARVIWHVQRLAPSLVRRAARRLASQERAIRADDPQPPRR
jgi:NAD(P)-dependent dehydrogenase (short-subunit alcohol dehydrogenase family)